MTQDTEATVVGSRKTLYRALDSALQEILSPEESISFEEGLLAQKCIAVIALWLTLRVYET